MHGLMHDPALAMVSIAELCGPGSHLSHDTNLFLVVTFRIDVPAIAKCCLSIPAYSCNTFRCSGVQTCIIIRSVQCLHCERAAVAGILGRTLQVAFVYLCLKREPLQSSFDKETILRQSFTHENGQGCLAAASLSQVK